MENHNRRSNNGSDNEMSELQKLIQTKAASAYEALAAKLSDGRKYVIINTNNNKNDGAKNRRPTTLDAMVFAHLLFQLRSPMGEKLLRPMVRNDYIAFINSSNERNAMVLSVSTRCRFRF